MTAYEISGRVQYMTDRTVRSEVRLALLHQLGLDLPAIADAAET